MRSIAFVFFIVIQFFQCLYAVEEQGISTCSNSQITQWKEIDVPPLKFEALSMLNLTGCRWEVKNENDSLIVKELIHPKSSELMKPSFIVSFTPNMFSERIITYDIDTGWIVARDQGEFDGETKWYSKEGKDNRSLINAPFIWLKKFNDAYVALTDNPYGGSFGVLYQDAVYFDQIVKFDAHPVAAIQNSANEFYVLTFRGLYFVDIESREKKLINSGKWTQLNPNSITIDSKGDLYIGLIGYLVRITISDDGVVHEAWLKELDG